MSFSPSRLPRSLHESPAYDPAWRYLQVEEYLRARSHGGDHQGSLILPSSERDSLVRSYFKFRCGVIGPKFAAFRYAQDCRETNARTATASRIKAMTVAGLPPVEVAKRLHTSVENIEMFQGLFFEVREYLPDRSAMGAILLPMTQDICGADARERVWLQAALHLGRAGLDYVMDQKVRLSNEEQKQISETIHTILAEESLRYAFTLQGRDDTGAEVMESYQKSVETRQRTPATDEKAAVFEAYLRAAAAERCREAGLLLDDTEQR